MTYQALPSSEAVRGIHPSASLAIGVSGFTGIALIHFIDLFSKWHETRYLAVLYLGLIAGTLAAAALLLMGRTRAGWVIGGTLAALTLAGYITSRAWGLPGAADDIGNWTEPLGAASMFIEGLVVLLSVAMLADRHQHVVDLADRLSSTPRNDLVQAG